MVLEAGRAGDYVEHRCVARLDDRDRRDQRCSVDRLQFSEKAEMGRRSDVLLRCRRGRDRLRAADEAGLEPGEQRRDALIGRARPIKPPIAVP